MDVAYRLCPEVDVHEMVGDVKRAVTWMKRNAGRTASNGRRWCWRAARPARTLRCWRLIAREMRTSHPPLRLRDSDCSVAGVVSYYGPVDLQAMYSHLLKTMGTSEPDPKRGNRRSAKLGGAIAKLLLGGQSIPSVTLPQLFTNLLGATPLDDPGAAAWPSRSTACRPGARRPCCSRAPMTLSCPSSRRAQCTPGLKRRECGRSTSSYRRPTTPSICSSRQSRCPRRWPSTTPSVPGPARRAGTGGRRLVETVAQAGNEQEPVAAGL